MSRCSQEVEWVDAEAFWLADAELKLRKYDTRLTRAEREGAEDERGQE